LTDYIISRTDIKAHMSVPANHPRKASLDVRHRLTGGLEEGIVAPAGLIAHGRGEAFDYLLGERTPVEAARAERAAVALLLAARKPVVCVNGNVAALCPGDVVALASAVGAELEVNLFYRSGGRERRIRRVLMEAGAKRVWGVGPRSRTVPGLSSERARADKPTVEADVVLVMLEDGDRTEYLMRMGKKVVAVDLNPLSRTARKASLTIVDNVVRALPRMTGYARSMRKWNRGRLALVYGGFDNKANLRVAESRIRSGLKRRR